MKEINNKNILITGGSQGLGRALAFELGRRGARVAIVARNSSPLEETALELRAAGIQAHAICADVGNADDALRIAAYAHQSLGHIDVLIHNASTLGPVPLPTLANLDTDDFRQVLEVNLLGPHRLTKAVGGNMLLRGAGTIVSISSDAAEQAYEGWGAYSAAKVALDHLGRIWAEETRDSGIRFLSIDPGEMATKMHADALPEADPTTLAQPADVARNILSILTSTNLASGTRLQAQQFGGQA